MPKIRVHELAKELNTTNKDIFAKMAEYGKNISNHMSSLDDSDVSRLRNDMKKGSAPPQAKEPEPPRPRPVGTDAKPLQRPPRPLLGPDGKPLPRPPRPVGADGKPITRPPLGPDGKPLRPPRPVGADGKPLPRPPRPVGAPSPAPAAEVKKETEKIENKPAERISQPPRTEAQQSPRPQGDRPPRQQGGGFSPRPPRPHGQGGFQNRPPHPQGDRPPRQQGGFTPRSQHPHGDRPPRPQGQGGFAPRPQGQGGFQNRPQGQGGFSPRPQGQGGFAPRSGGGAPGGNRPAFGGGGGGRPTEVKKTEPTKDDKRQQWNRLQQANSISKKDKKDSFGKENRQGFDRRAGRSKPAKRVIVPRVQPTVTMITVAPEITVRDLAEKLLRSNADVIKVLMKNGIMVTANQSIDFEAASTVAESFGVLVDEYVEVDVFEEAFSSAPDDESSLVPRPPVVVVMGHVDHGKTSLLDCIRNSNVQQSESGGITQHIGAYSVRLKDNENKRITFLDTPGHEAFTAMRMRGAQITDIAILVVAADDGVMPQTVEAINHAKAAGVDIVVAITMMDKPDANPDKVKQQLTDHGLQPEDWGGQTITVPVSARTKMGIEQLLEMLLLVAELKELRANPNKPARGSIIEAKLDKGRGPVATILVQEGTLRVGDPVVAGACFGKVRAMVNSRGKNVKEAGPSRTVEIIGLAEVPATGDVLYAATSDKQARQLSESVVAKGRIGMIKTSQGKVSLDDLFNQIQAGQVKDLNIVVKADVQGSVEALRGSLEKLTNDAVRVRIIHTGVGAITESDVMLASASNAIILGFNVRPDVAAKSVAENENVDIRMYSVIYSAIDDIEAAMKGMLDPEFIEKILGYAEIRQIFKASGIGTIGGCHVTEGKITRNAQIRIVRDGRVIYDGHLDTLKRFKEDAKEVASGYECGMCFKNYNDIKEGDKVEAYVMEEIPR
jgi:translation initiation factor IF-2